VTKILKIWMTELLGERVPFFRVRRVNAYLSMQKKIIFMGKGINRGERVCKIDLAILKGIIWQKTFNLYF